MSKKRQLKTSPILQTDESPSQVETTVPLTVNGISERTSSIKSETRYGVIYNARFVNVRDEPSQTGNVIRVANEGERLMILYEENGFYKVQFTDGTSGFVATEFVDEVHGGNPDDFFSKSESILTSVKKLLGIDETCEEFDLDITLAINSAMFTLMQLGVGPEDGFRITNKNTTYSDYLGENSILIPEVKMYLYYKTKLSWDPPSSSVLSETLKQRASESEWRLLIQAEEAGEISK